MKIRFWTEVLMLRYLEDDAKFETASATAVSFPAEGRRRFTELFERCREKVRRHRARLRAQHGQPLAQALRQHFPR